MRHLAGRVDTETTTELKPVARVRSSLPKFMDSSVEVQAITLKRRSSVLPTSRKEHIKDYQLEEPPLEHVSDLACDDDALEEMRVAPPPLGMVGVSEGEEKKNFDLMNINITIYGIAGILCEEKDPKKSSIKLVKRRSLLKATKSRDSSKATDQTEESTTDIPTTVAASVKRNAISSQTVIETFLPSQPLNVQSAPGRGTKLSALWQAPSDRLLGLEERQDENEDPKEEQSSFEVIRMMMKKPFTREQNPGLVENYVHEHVQIGINLCRGKELMRLGVATLIITGEEEGRVMMHVPARPCTNPGIQERNSSSKKSRSSRKKKIKTTFENDNRTFRLDENSSLCLGVQVNPRQDVEAAEQYREIEPSDSHLLRNAHAAKAYMMDVREKYGCTNVEEESTTSSSSTSDDDGPAKSKGKVVAQKPAIASATTRMHSVIPESMLAGFFCGALPTMLADSNGTQPNNNSTKSVKNMPSSSSEEEKVSLDSVLARKDSLLMTEVVNMKYAPAYAKSFFSAVTFANTELSDDEDDIVEEDLQGFSELVEQSARKLALS